jgi:hypothetical protein
MWSWFSGCLTDCLAPLCRGFFQYFHWGNLVGVLRWGWRRSLSWEHLALCCHATAWPTGKPQNSRLSSSVRNGAIGSSCFKRTLMQFFSSWKCHLL